MLHRFSPLPLSYFIAHASFPWVTLETERIYCQMIVHDILLRYRMNSSILLLRILDHEVYLQVLNKLGTRRADECVKSNPDDSTTAISKTTIATFFHARYAYELCYIRTSFFKLWHEEGRVNWIYIHYICVHPGDQTCNIHQVVSY